VGAPLGYASEAKYENKGGPGMSAILEKLRGSTQAMVDRQNFLSTQLLFWMLAAPDGHAKNFSVFLEKNEGFRLTPLYDVLSAWPVIGEGANQFQWQKATMAMAVRASNAHYKMNEIERRHWNEVAKRNAVGSDFEEVILQFIAKTPAALAQVASWLPAEFPANVADPIFEGILRQVRALERQA
jgi:serine/threonine-protein kinase HipA